MLIQFVWVHALLIRQSDDIKMNPGPRPNPYHSFSMWHWNLNNLTAHNYLIVSLLGIPWYWEIWFECLSKIYLDSSNLSDDDNFNLPNYNAVRADCCMFTKIKQ